MMTTDIKAVMAKWNRQIANVPPELRDAAQKANAQSGDEMAKRLRKAAPLGPGPDHIRDTVTVTAGDPDKLETVVEMGSNALEYILPLEFGYKRGGKIVPGQRFFRSVRTVMRKKHRGRMTRALRKALKALYTV